MARNVRQRLEPALGSKGKRERPNRPHPQVELQESVAELLRRTREQYGEDLKAVAEALRIRHVHLKSIEDGRFRDLPGPAYAMGFVRSYAEHLGLDGPQIVERFKDEVEGLNRKTQLVFPTPVPEGKVPGGALILISLLLMGVAYGGWIYLSNQGKTIADLIPPVPERLQTLVGGGDPQEAETAAAEAPAEEFRTAESRSAERAAPEGAPAASETGSQAGERTASAPAEGLAAPPRSAAVMPVEQVPTDGEPAAARPAGDEASAEAGVIPPSDEFDSAGPAPAAETEADEPLHFDLSGTADGSPAGPETGAAAPAAPESVAPARAAEADGAAPEIAPEEAPTLARVIDAQARANSEAEQAAAIPAAPQLAARVEGREPQVYGADNEDARIVLRAKLDSWVQIRDGEDGLVMTRVLREGDIYRVPNQEGLTLLTGNAGGIEIMVDGAALAPIGPVGSVRRDVALDPELLVQGRAVAQ